LEFDNFKSKLNLNNTNIEKIFGKFGANFQKLIEENIYKEGINLKNNLINKGAEKEFIYIGCQIINKKLFIKEKIENYSILEIWNNLLDQKKLLVMKAKKTFII